VLVPLTSTSMNEMKMKSSTIATTKVTPAPPVHSSH
jgi:hypothetical protein